MSAPKDDGEFAGPLIALQLTEEAVSVEVLSAEGDRVVFSTPAGSEDLDRLGILGPPGS